MLLNFQLYRRFCFVDIVEESQRLNTNLFVATISGQIPLGTSILALCPQTVPSIANFKPTFESKGPPIVADKSTLDAQKKEEKCFL